ncbi:hypothetical protein CHLRE_12g517050v5 [Chlamydomonas reinhardtii]|uniref:Uncharacterized protein n=1 Tax=Chlamydomonas reinhardtii TaxID=3055 RepID=A8J6A9_CHLRE|nr:uncharacterized protein CHLRE_12g517050v5 [Chlamydomonas reinhardtii]PNW75203.1 hypothetical protein CHLRE_12g517050v5 [Chlamydomonas reinhardtii]|eukprot:XP_001696960.1 flagellar associated protein [Chlamydomonas reinhardtii]
MPVEVAGTVSTFGQQSLSTKPTEPRTKIGTSTRTDKLAGAQYEAKLLGGTSKGVTTNLVSGFGLQPSSRAQSAPSYRFGSRFQLDHEAGESRQGSRLGPGGETGGEAPRYGNPGPGAYSSPRLQPDSVGRQVQSINTTEPTARVGTERRFGIFKDEFATPSPGSFKPASGWIGDAPTYSFHGGSRRADMAKGLPGNTPSALQSPGAGTYEAPSALFNQASSKKPTAPRTRVGTAGRDQQRKVFVSKGHERESQGAHSPSPNAYSPKHTFNSKVKSSGGWGFGSGDRFSEVKSNNGKELKVLTPGPGSYVV